MDTGEVLRRSRRRAGLTQRELAVRAVVAQSTVARIEGGHLDPRASTLDRLLRACGSRLGPVPLGDIDRTVITERLARTPRQRILDNQVAASGVARLRGLAR